LKNFNLDDDFIEENTTLYAKWEKDVEYVFDAN
jgi:hypothetical protein